MLLPAVAIRSNNAGAGLNAPCFLPAYQHPLIARARLCMQYKREQKLWGVRYNIEAGQQSNYKKFITFQSHAQSQMAVIVLSPTVAIRSNNTGAGLNAPRFLPAYQHTLIARARLCMQYKREHKLRGVRYNIEAVQQSNYTKFITFQSHA